MLHTVLTVVLQGCKVIFDVMTKAGGKEVPIRLVLGSDAYAGVIGKCDSTKALLEEWKDVATATDHEVQHY